MFFHGHVSFWGVFSSANRFGKETNSMGYEINHHNLLFHSKKTDWWCLSVCANRCQISFCTVDYRSSDISMIRESDKNGNIAWCQDMHAVQLMQIRWYKHHLKLRPWPNKLDSFSSSPSWTRCPHEQLLIPWGGYRLNTRLKTKKTHAERLTAKNVSSSHGLVSSSISRSCKFHSSSCQILQMHQE